MSSAVLVPKRDDGGVEQNERCYSQVPVRQCVSLRERLLRLVPMLKDGAIASLQAGSTAAGKDQKARKHVGFKPALGRVNLEPVSSAKTAMDCE